MKAAGPVPYPPSHFKVWGRGATSSVSEGGSQRAGHLPKAMQHIRGYNPGILDCSQAGQSLGGCAALVDGRGSAGEFIDSLSIWMINSPPKTPPRLLSITALGYLISWPIQRSSATWRPACSIIPSSNKGPCYQTRAEGSASRRTWPGDRGHAPFVSPSKSPRNPLGRSWYLH